MSITSGIWPFFLAILLTRRMAVTTSGMLEAIPVSPFAPYQVMDIWGGSFVPLVCQRLVVVVQMVMRNENDQ